MKNISYLKLFMIVCIWILLCNPVFVSAEAGSEAEFIVRAVIPDNQADLEHTYFDLNMEVSGEQTVEVEIWNLTDQEIQVEAQIHSASTNKNGVIEYGETGNQPDDTLPYSMEELITCDNLVTVPANSTTMLELYIQMPEEEYEGILAGGITLKLVEDEETEAADSADNLAIQNTYSYVIGIILRESEKEVEPALVLNDISYDKAAGASVISANIQNIMAAYTNNLEISAWITRKGTKGTLYQAFGENMRMAPNSNFNFQIDLKGKSLNEGDFTIYITARTAEKEWNWEKDFTVESGIVYAGETKVYEEKSTGYLWLIAVIPAIFLLAAVIVYRYKKMLKIRRKYKKAIMKDL